MAGAAARPPPGPQGAARAGEVGDPVAAARTSQLRLVIAEVLECEVEGTLEPAMLDGILRRHPKDGRGFFAKREILSAYRSEAADWPMSEADFAERIRTCPTRSQSGVLPVTVLTKPFPCPGKCVFCPDDVRMPKSYLSDEPGCQRALANDFDPYRQTWSRLHAYRDMGHRTDKVEMIVLGGTWSSYPERYQRWFVARCFEAMNDFGSGLDRREEAVVEAEQAQTDGNRVDAADWARVEEAHRSNEQAASRCVGLALETRPDHVTPGEVERLRRLGVTKVQLGLQSLDDEVLAKNGRGHDLASSRKAMALLRGAGFKLHVHWMPNLVGATSQSDREDFRRLFEDTAVRPDELKVYPCSLIETAELMDIHRRGEWQPYGEEELVSLLADCLPEVPEWCRVTRVIRDIPSPDIVVGNRKTNLREVVEARIRAEGGTLGEIRSREVRQERLNRDELVLEERSYATSIGEERFLEWQTPAGRIAAFCRLSLPRAEAPLAELHGVALLREVHVYGPAASLKERGFGQAQHAGLGTQLVERAAVLARENGFPKLSVISAVGTRSWYRRLGFVDGPLYQHLSLP